jgi:hypothetical protein
MIKLPEGYGKAVEAAAETAKEFLGKITNSPAEEFGFVLGDKIRNYRFKKQVKMLTDAHEILKQAGIEPKKVSLKTLCPILDGVALEEDESMSVRWTTLLATAANPPKHSCRSAKFSQNSKAVVTTRSKDARFDL